eukprot:TRINITY_DN33237_c0_g1_i1.p1 TRINITY_DN33237_c0_g1~~TRINITY_DN33237_c0_g1_i1.p1  ORF type:complete len:536 (+),score=233.72 TRINITY_DN33237_c0_g1_i1:48-1655(+)
MGPKKSAAKPGGKKKPAAKADKGDDDKKEKKGDKKAAAGAGSNAVKELKKEPFTEETACLLIQRIARGMAARRTAGAARAEKEKETLAELEEAALVNQMRYEKKRRDQNSKVKSEKQDKEKAFIELQDRLFTAAFDNEMDDFKQAMKEKADIFKADPEGNYCIGEAAVNGSVDVLKYLIELGADPNIRGAFERTPLWRAAYNSHDEAIQILLNAGADPRLSAQSQTPGELASGKCKEVLDAWDVKKTDAMLARLEQAREEREAARKADAERLAASLEEEVTAVKGRYETGRKHLQHAKCEYERRIYEYDCVYHDAGKTQELRDIALGCVKEAEKNLEKAVKEFDELEHEYLTAKTKMMVHKQEELDEAEPGVEIKFTQVPDIVLSDSRGAYRNSDKWPLVIDYTGRTSVFLRYRNTNVINTMHPHQMEPEQIRKSLLGSLRWGKPMVVDLNDIPLLDHTVEAFNKVAEGLWDKVMKKEIVKDFDFLIKDSDGKEYQRARFNDSMLEEFVVVILTSSRVIEAPLLETFCAFRIECD